MAADIPVILPSRKIVGEDADWAKALYMQPSFVVYLWLRASIKTANPA